MAVIGCSAERRRGIEYVRWTVFWEVEMQFKVDRSDSDVENLPGGIVPFL